MIVKTYPKISKESELSSKYGGVVVKGLKKDVKVEDILEVLKYAGLPKSFTEEDLKLTERGNNLSIFIHNLQPKRCIKLVNNLNGKTVLNQTLKIFALVDETPEKVAKPETVNKDNDVGELAAQDQLGTLASNMSSKPPAPLSPLSSVSLPMASSSGSNSTPAKTPISKFWNNEESLSSSEEESSDDES